MNHDDGGEDPSSTATPALIDDVRDSNAGSSAGLIAGVTVACLVIVAVIAGVILIYLWKKRRHSSDSNRNAVEGKEKITHGSSTLKSDKSDHPYENPTLCRAGTEAERGTTGSHPHGDQYAGLKGQSLPHHYEGLGQNSVKSDGQADEYIYDELLTSSQGESSAYYLKLDPSVSGSISGVAPHGESKLAGATDRPYDQIEIGNICKNTSKNGDDESDVENSDYYFKLEKSAKDGDSSTVERHEGKAGDTCNNSSRNGDIESDFENSDYYFKLESAANASLTQEKRGGADDEEGNLHAEAKPSSASKPNLAAQTTAAKSSSYDRLNRTDLTEPKSEDRNGNEYSKLLPRLATQNGPAPPTGSGGGYLTVRIDNECAQKVDMNDENNPEESDYNKLDRGVEREIGNLSTCDFETPNASRDDLSNNVPVEL